MGDQRGVGQGADADGDVVATVCLRLILGVLGLTDVTFVAGGGAKVADLGEQTMDRVRTVRSTGRKRGSAMSEIEGKVVAITGASAGIGEAITLHLAERGAKVVLGARKPDAWRPWPSVSPPPAEMPPTSSPTSPARGPHGAGGSRLRAFRQARRAGQQCGDRADLGPGRSAGRRVRSHGRRQYKGLLHRSAAALPVCRRQGFGHFGNTASTAGLKTVTKEAVYSGTKVAVRAISEGLRQEAGDAMRVTLITPGFVRTDFVEAIADPAFRAQMIEARDKMALAPEAIARAVAFAIGQPADADVGEIVVRPTVQA